MMKSTDKNNKDINILVVIVIGFLIGNYTCFFTKISNLKIMPIVAIIGIISGIILLYFDGKSDRNIILYIIYTFFFLGILFFIIYSRTNYQMAVKISGTTKNILFEVKSKSLSSYNSYMYEAKIIGFEKPLLDNTMFFRLYTENEFNVGDVILSNVKFSLPTNNSDFDYRLYLASKGYYLQGNISKTETPYIIDELKKNNLLNNIRQYFKDLYFSNLDKESASIALAMTIGDRSFLSETNKSSLAFSGLMHIISVSGSHFSILTDFLAIFLKKIGVKRKLVANISIAFSLFYLFLVGLDPAVLRSAIMSIMFFVSMIIDRSYDRLSSLSFAALISCIINPFMIISAGFILSYLSIIGIFYVSPHVKRFLYKYYERFTEKIEPKKYYGYILNGLSVTLGVNIILLPFNVYYFNKISLVAPITNLLTEPIIPIILFFSLLLPIAKLIKIDFFITLVGGILSLFTKIFITISDIFSSLFFSSIKVSLDQMFFVVLVIIIMIILYNIRKKKKESGKIIFTVITILVLVFSFSFKKIDENSKTFFHSVSTSTSNSFVIYNRENVVVVVKNSSIFDGRSINSFLEKSGKNEMDLLIVCDDNAETISSAADIIEKYNVKNVISNTTILSKVKGVKMIGFTPSKVIINNVINVDIIDNSVYISLKGFSVAIHQDFIKTSSSNITYISKKDILKEEFDSIKSDFFIGKPIYPTSIYEIIPNTYDEITLVWDNNKKEWSEIY